MPTTYPISELVLDDRCQPRERLSTDVVSAYAEHYAARSDLDPLPPPSVAIVDGAPWVIDGWHRVAAARIAGVIRLEVEIADPNADADHAVWLSTAANRAHGLRRSSGDLRHAVLAAIACPIAATMSDAEIARHVGCSRPYVQRLRAPAKPPKQVTPAAPKITESRIEYDTTEDKPAARPSKTPTKSTKSYPHPVETATSSTSLHGKSSDKPAPVDTSAYEDMVREVRRHLERAPWPPRPSQVQARVAQYLRQAEVAIREAQMVECPSCSGDGCAHCAGEGRLPRIAARSLEGR